MIVKGIEKLFGTRGPKKVDKNEIAFLAEAIRVTQKRWAGAFGGGEGKKLLRDLYAEYSSTAVSFETKAIQAWFLRKLPGLFQSVGKPPKWLYEGEWPFYEGKPMVFFFQASVPTNRTSRELASPGDELFVFGARKDVPEEGGWEMVYSVVSQSRDLVGL